MFCSRTPVLLTVLWALGWSMIVLAALIRLPLRVLAAISIGMIALHNLLDGAQAAQFGGAAGIWNILHQSGFFMLGGTAIVAAYPLIPWIGVMAGGYCLAQGFTLESEEWRKGLVRIGLSMTAR